MPNRPTRNERRKGEDRSETLIIPHITKEMLNKAREMAEAGASRAEIEQAIAAMQQTPAQPAEPVQESKRPAAHKPLFAATSRRRHTPEEREAMQGRLQREQEAKEAARREEAKRPLKQSSWELRPADRTVEPDPQPQKPAAEPIQAAPAPENTAAPITPQAEPVRHAEPKPEPHTRSKLPRSYKEAEAELNEKIRRDHIWLSNPVMVRGLGLAPIIGAALDGQRALMLCVASLILVTFTRTLAVAVCHLTDNRFRPVIYCYSAAILYIPTYVLLYRLFGADLSLLGIYLPILAVEPAIVKRMEFTELEPVSTALRHGFNNAVGMCAALLLVGCLREFLATGAVFGQQLVATALLPMAALPSGGFVLLGLLAAGWCAVANLYTDYKHEEVRRLYADRKH